MIERTRVVAALKIDLEFVENHAERLFSLVPHITDLNAKENSLDLAREAQRKAAEIRERISELEGGA